MGLQLNGSSQWLQAAWAPGGSMQPMTFMAWVRRATIATEDTVISAGDVDGDLTFNNLQAWDDRTRAISFNNYAEAQTSTVIPINTVTFIAGVFDGSAIRLYLGSADPVSAAWSPGTSAIDQLRIGNTASSVRTGYFDGVIEHAAVWRAALTTEQITALRTLASAPTDIANLIAYLPLKADLTDEVGTLSWSAQGSPSTYVDLGISYGAGTYTVTYVANNGFGTLADASSPYEESDTVTVLSPTGAITRPGYTFASWNTAANGSGTSYDPSDTFAMGTANVTLYAQWTKGARVINHENVDASVLSLAQVDAAAALKVYFEHASTGQDIVGDSDTDTSAGRNYNDTQDCGLNLLHVANSRYLADRESLSSSYDASWFSTHAGIQDNNRGNPTPAVKVSGFQSSVAALASSIQVAMFKYCWIDVWAETSGYISDGAAAAASDISAVTTLESTHGIVIPLVTMPLQSNASYAARQAYNDAIRTYCAANNHWLWDFADVECWYGGARQIDGDAREIAHSSYVLADGGHLSTTAALLLAHSFWILLAGIAAMTEYALSGVTRDASGDPLGGCTVSLLRHLGSGVLEYVDTTTSDASTGAYEFTGLINDSSYLCVMRLAGSPTVYDCTDWTLQPEEVA